MRHASLDDDLRFDLVNNLLKANDIFRQLNDGTPEPAESVSVFLVPPATKPRLRNGCESLV